MKYSELIRELSIDTGISQEAIQYILHRFIGISIEGLINDGSVTLKNWGTLKSTPKENEVRVTFTASRNLKKALTMQHEEFKDLKNFINRETWLDAVAWSKENEKRVPKNVEETPSQDSGTEHKIDAVLDDFFDYDDE